ncbi:hypothetical protein EDB80DRAFT_733064 [Ilyonectria destructans]|nr:hypothetical protein EDB80DRAFT_733064 [Ilyonectria destructans]
MCFFFVTLAVDLRALGRINPLPFLTMLTPAGRVPIHRVTGTSFTCNDGIGCVDSFLTIVKRGHCSLRPWSASSIRQSLPCDTPPPIRPLYR